MHNAPENLLLPEAEKARLQAEAMELPSWTLTPRQLCDVELLLNGGFSPLSGFLERQDYESVLENMRLADGRLWPMPIMLDVPENVMAQAREARRLALLEPEGMTLAVLEVGDCWPVEREREALAVYGTDHPAHPGVARLLQQHDWYIGGKLLGLQLPNHYDFMHLRHTPQELHSIFSRMGWERVVAFQTRNPMHRAHLELTTRAARQAEANLLIHPVVGQTRPGDVDHFTRVRCYEKLLPRYPAHTAMLSLLPLAMRMAGPREALWHAMIRKNYGCTHFIVGRDHAGPGRRPDGTAWYDPYAAQTLVREHAAEIGMHLVPFRKVAWVPARGRYCTEEEIRPEDEVLELSGTELRNRLEQGLDVPDWFSWPEVMAELRKRYPPRHQQGFTVFFTGLSGAGKSTLANALMIRLLEEGNRPVTLLDGDIVRKHLSSELGFSREHRELNVRRIGFVASEITKNRGVAICAPIAPYAATRREVREMIQRHGPFIEVHISTPLAVCEQRDRKGLYAAARAGKIQHFTGISDPYEVPENPEIRVDTSQLSPEQAVQRILLKLEAMGLILPERN